MNIHIIGTSKITLKHIQVLKKNFKILSISSTRKSSKNLVSISKKFNIDRVFYDWKKSIQFARKIQNSSFLITSRIKDNKKVLEECCKTKKKIFIEKPVFLKSQNFSKFLKFNNKIFLGYNRIFYENIRYLKKTIASKKNMNVFVNCPEISNKSIITNSCHIISILIFLFEELKIEKVFKQKDFINCIAKDKNKNFIYLSFNLRSSNNFSIEINNRKKRYLLSPIENLKIYDGIISKTFNNQKIFQPQLRKTINEFNKNKFKPGFLNQSIEFKKFLKGKKIINDLKFGKNILKILEKILL